MKKMIYLLLICCLLVSNTTGCSKNVESKVVDDAITSSESKAADNITTPSESKVADNATTPSESTNKASEQSKEELYQDVFITLLAPYIQEAINDYYKDYLTTSPNYSPEYSEVLNITRPMGYRSFSFIIKLQVKPFVGSHVDIGIDQLTIRVGSGEGEVKVEKFEHIKSYYDELPPNLKGIVIKAN